MSDAAERGGDLLLVAAGEVRVGQREARDGVGRIGLSAAIKRKYCLQLAYTTRQVSAVTCQPDAAGCNETGPMRRHSRMEGATYLRGASADTRAADMLSAPVVYRETE